LAVSQSSNGWGTIPGDGHAPPDIPISYPAVHVA
jgi:hypothetical protein